MSKSATRSCGRRRSCTSALPAGSTVSAPSTPRACCRNTQIDLAKTNKLGISPKLVKADAVLRDRDRIEIYRPLIADPKEVRRKRAEKARS